MNSDNYIGFRCGMKVSNGIMKSQDQYRVAIGRATGLPIGRVNAVGYHCSWRLSKTISKGGQSR